jgi:hypothetical protein
MIWYITRDSSKAELRRRGITKGCPDCGLKHKLPFALIVGPGVAATPLCSCRIAMTTPYSAYASDQDEAAIEWHKAFNMLIGGAQ